MSKENRIIGLTGPTGSGKSTVAKVWQEMGATVLSADAYARAVVPTGSPVLRQIAEAFSADILTADGALDRAKLADIVFADPAKKQLLESITHPAICQRMRQDAEAAFAAGAAVVVFDSPLLFEAGQDAVCDKTVAVVSQAETRRARIMARDGLTYEQAAARMAAQPSEDFYRKRADTVIPNDGTTDELAALAREVLVWR